MSNDNGRVTNKLLFDMMEGRFDRMEVKMDEAGKRITILEIYKANLAGKITILVGIVSFVVVCTWEYISSKFKG